MPQDRPAAADLLEVVALFLEHEVVPSAESGISFRARVAANTLRIVAREFLLGERCIRDDLAALADILGESAPADTALDKLSENVMRLNHQLCERIRANSGLDRTQLLGALRRMVENKLAVANPGLLESERRIRSGRA